ncbi:DUF4129 domain-containing protein [Pseudomonas oligotrophica]|uniref:DUF4129 domain-containing protein n=1 Tax=Pseudomonas oligotrophica TaxID=2912055 RepID=UPI001F1FBAEC|nr:DUF4129 domain-containing protein [Pseudomonas oligotrophica]MCF7203386.1 DUF4129 domain-containing protein [Pseudomonas oligotrophica]
MRLTDTTLAVRPRDNWEALDLGILLARRHARVLLAGWAVLTLPVFALLSLLFWQHPGIALLLFWWLKPLFERLPLHVLSEALFGEVPSLRQSLRAWPHLLRRQWFASLTWRRPSLTRSFDLPVLQLEELGGAERRQRLQVLHRRSAGSARWLTLVGAHLEAVLWLGLSLVLLMLLPAQALQQWSWQELLLAEHDWLWLEHLSNLLYVLVLIVWEPLYVACGFSLYLNRRTHLEAWDIELSFRRLRQRLLTPMAWAALALTLGLAVPTTDALADSPADTDAPALSREAAGERIRALLAEPPFHQPETVTRWRLRETGGESPQPPAGLFRLDSLWRVLEYAASLLEALLWAALLLGAALLAWRYRQWLRVFARLEHNAPAASHATARVLGLDVSPQSLPEDVAGEAERLWAEQPRVAVGLLYRALLSRLLHDYRLPLLAAHTEGEVLQLLCRLDEPQLQAYAGTLTGYWQQLAYGHRALPPAAGEALCAGWRALFPRGTQP